MVSISSGELLFLRSVVRVLYRSVNSSSESILRNFVVTANVLGIDSNCRKYSCSSRTSLWENSKPSKITTHNKHRGIESIGTVFFIRQTFNLNFKEFFLTCILERRHSLCRPTSREKRAYFFAARIPETKGNRHPNQAGTTTASPRILVCCSYQQ